MLYCDIFCGSLNLHSGYGKNLKTSRYVKPIFRMIFYHSTTNAYILNCLNLIILICWLKIITHRNVKFPTVLCVVRLQPVWCDSTLCYVVRLRHRCCCSWRRRTRSGSCVPSSRTSCLHPTTPALSSAYRWAMLLWFCVQLENCFSHWLPNLLTIGSRINDKI